MTNAEIGHSDLHPIKIGHSDLHPIKIGHTATYIKSLKYRLQGHHNLAVPQ